MGMAAIVRPNSIDDFTRTMIKSCMLTEISAILSLVYSRYTNKEEKVKFENANHDLIELVHD